MTRGRKERSVLPAATLYDVARLAGVSPATVSRVLSGNPKVTPENRERVLRAVRELGYRPNLIASALTTKQTRTLGLLVPDISNPFFAEICRAVEESCLARGFSLVICNTDEKQDREQAHVDLLRQKGVDGLIFASATVTQSTVIGTLRDEGFPLVLIAREPDQVEVDAIAADDFQGGYIATRHLIGLGHRRIALLAGPLRTKPALFRKKGFEAALEEAGIPLDPALVRPCEFNIAGGREAAAEILDSAGRPPTAIVAGNDMIAVGAMRTLRQRGFRIPEEISITGYDHTVLADVTEPPLTSVESPTGEMGRHAVELLLSRVAGSHAAPTRIVLPVRLHIGESTAALAINQ